MIRQGMYVTCKLENCKVLKNLLKRVGAFQVELELGSVSCLRREETGVPGGGRVGKLSEQYWREPNTNSTHI